MAISRILSSTEADAMIIYLIGISPNAQHRGRRSQTAATVTVMRQYPRVDSEFLRSGADRLSSLCFVLHRMGFFVPRELLRER